MQNVEFRVDGDTLTIVVDLSKRFGPSSTGKTTIVASSGGYQQVANSQVKVSINAVVK